jgi:hypothetical protein
MYTGVADLLIDFSDLPQAVHTATTVKSKIAIRNRIIEQ